MNRNRRVYEDYQPAVLDKVERHMNEQRKVGEVVQPEVDDDFVEDHVDLQQDDQ